jgi:serine/threonine protein phosphatase PrpC
VDNTERYGAKFQVEAWVGSDLGQVRNKNEDNFLVDALNGLFIVADGMGGGVQGEKASRRAIETFSATLYNNRNLLRALELQVDQSMRQQLSDLLYQAIHAANQEILRIRRSFGAKVTMGTTLTAFLLLGQNAAIAHIGDSRIYRVRYRDLRQLTMDHSLVAEQVREGFITQEQADISPFRNVLVQAIGKSDKIDPQIEFLDVEMGDQYLLCSDGLSNYLTGAEIITVMGEPEGYRIVPRLIDCANARGGSDNITAIAIRLSSAEHYQPTTEIDLSRSLGNAPLLRGLKANESMRLLQLGKTFDYIAGERIISEDAVDRSMYLIFDGKVGLYRGGHWLSTLETGQHFGLFSLLDGQGRLSTAIAESPVRLLEIARNDFVDLLRREPNLGVKIVWNLLKDLSFSHRQTVSRLLKALSSNQPPTPSEEIDESCE